MDDDRRDIEAEDWPRLLARNLPVVRGLVARRLAAGHRDAVDDVTQVVLLRVYQELAAGRRYRDANGVPIPFRAVLAKVVEWEVGGWFVAGRRVPVPVDPTDGGADDPGYGERLLRVDLERCLERLPEQERAVVRLSLLEDMPAAAIAQRLGTSANNVYQRLHHGVRKLVECLDG